ncbi:GNAT family protein [Bacillaceae bacterium S4-13-58]
MGKRIIIESEELYLRPFQKKDARNLFRLVYDNQYFWSKVEPDHHPNYYTYNVQKQRLQDMIHSTGKGKEFNCGIFLREKEQLIGEISIFHILRGPLNQGMVGFSLSKDYVGKGYGTQSLALMTKYAFNDLQLHRVEAAVAPSNIPSISILEKNGFVKEGLLRGYLLMKGQWKDHLLYSKLEND